MDGIQDQIIQSMRIVSNALGGPDGFVELLLELPDSVLSGSSPERLAAWERMRRAAVRGERDVEALARLVTPAGDAGIPNKPPCPLERTA
jgi:hypothetical protein